MKESLGIAVQRLPIHFRGAARISADRRCRLLSTDWRQRPAFAASTFERAFNGQDVLASSFSKKSYHWPKPKSTDRSVDRLRSPRNACADFNLRYGHLRGTRAPNFVRFSQTGSLLALNSQPATVSSSPLRHSVKRRLDRGAPPEIRRTPRLPRRMA